MATAFSLDEVLQASPTKDNYFRLMNLLTSGGTKAVRGLFDSIISSRNLANKLSHPLVLGTLQDLKNKRILNNDQWNKLFSPSSGVVSSEWFDITLLVLLLRNICGLNTTPANGWKNLPLSTDISPEADLTRIKYYRNKISHDSGSMELSDDAFNRYWIEIKEAILRILSIYNDSSTVLKCEKQIDKRLTAPLTHKDRQLVRERLGIPELIVLLVTEVISTGLELIQGSALILKNGITNIVEYFDNIRGVAVVDVTDGSVKIVLWVTELNALEKFWRRYETGELRKDLESVLITEEIKQLANGEAVALKVHLSEEQYKTAREHLKAKEEELAEEELAEEELAEEFERKMRLEKTASQFEIFDGDIVEDDKNKFQAHLAVITSKDQVEQVLEELKNKDPDAAEATHNIWAYRIFDDEKDTYIENCDDDGDENSGARVLYFLKRTKAVNVVVIVSCWYETSADDLGDVRFKCIQKSVLDLFLTYGIVQIPTSIIQKIFEEIKYTPFEKMSEKKVQKLDIIHGETIEDRKSTFQAHLADITSRKQVDQVLVELKKDRKIAKATYNMWACRVYDEKKKSYQVEEGFDDGENLGGERLLHLLQRSDAKNVVIIVTRWHGGIHIGNDRFKHINKCASDLLQQRSRLAEPSATPTDPKKTKKEKTKKHK